MRPLTVITGIVLGSCLSITISLAAVMLVFWFVGSEEPRIAHESEGLLSITAMFLGLTAVSAMSFYSLLKESRFRWWWQANMWFWLLLGILYLLPEGTLAGTGTG